VPAQLEKLCHEESNPHVIPARALIHTRFAGAGGKAGNRSSERHQREIAYLRRKWGPYLDVVQPKGKTRLVLRVKR